MSKFHGVIPPVVVPLTPGYEVDWPSYTRVLEHLIAGGVHGLFVLGSTSEVVFHDEATRRRIIEHSVKIAAGRIPVLAGVIDPATDRMIGHARAARDAGAAAIVVTAPFYTRTSAGASGVGGFKTAMRRLGIIQTNLMARPQRSLNDEEAARIDTILRATGLLA